MRKCETILDTKLAGFFILIPPSDYPHLRHFLSGPKNQVRLGTFLLEFLMGCGEKEEWKKLTMEDLLRAISHKKNENPQNALAKEMSYALHRLREYWLWCAQEKESPAAEIRVHQYLWQNFGISPTTLELEKINHKLRQSPISHQAEIHKNWAIFTYHLSLETQGRTRSISVQPILSAIDQQYRFEKLKYACAAINQDKILSTHHSLWGMEEITQFMQAHFADTTLLLQGYYLAYQMMVSSDHESYSQQLFEIIHPPRRDAGDISDRLPTNELLPNADWKALNQYLDNHCIRQINEGNLNYLTLLAEIYSTQIPPFLQSGNTPPEPEKFKNIITVLAEGGKLWVAEQFLAQYRNIIQPNSSHRAEAFIEFSKGIILFFQRKYPSAEATFLESIRLSDDIFIGINARLWMLKIWVELGNWDQLTQGLASYRVYVQRRKSQLPARTAHYHSFQLALNQYLSAMEGTKAHKKTKLEALAKELSELKQNIHLRWLIGMIEKSYK